jgi:hypothetical protein
MRDPNEEPKRRDAMAIAALPFMHPRLAAVEMTGEMELTYEDKLKQLEELAGLSSVENSAPR